jgi:hypothetical protein
VTPYVLQVVDAFFEIVDHVGPQPDADTFFAFLNVDGPKKEVRDKWR